MLHLVTKSYTPLFKRVSLKQRCDVWVSLPGSGLQMDAFCGPAHLQWVNPLTCDTIYGVPQHPFQYTLQDGWPNPNGRFKASQKAAMAAKLMTSLVK